MCSYGDIGKTSLGFNVVTLKRSDVGVGSSIHYLQVSNMPPNVALSPIMQHETKYKI